MWVIVHNMESTTFAVMAKKPLQRSIRFVAENHEFVDSIAEELHDAAVYTDKNFSMALNLLISYCRVKGISPQELVATVMTEGREESKKAK